MRPWGVLRRLVLVAVAMTACVASVRVTLIDHDWAEEATNQNIALGEAPCDGGCNTGWGLHCTLTENSVGFSGDCDQRCIKVGHEQSLRDLRSFYLRSYRYVAPLVHTLLRVHGAPSTCNPQDSGEWTSIRYSPDPYHWSANNNQFQEMFTVSYGSDQGGDFVTVDRDQWYVFEHEYTLPEDMQLDHINFRIAHTDFSDLDEVFYSRIRFQVDSVDGIDPGTDALLSTLPQDQWLPFWASTLHQGMDRAMSTDPDESHGPEWVRRYDPDSESCKFVAPGNGRTAYRRSGEEDPLSISLSDIPEHHTVRLDFKLATLRNWRNDGVSLALDGTEVWSGGFSTLDLHDQCYPEPAGCATPANPRFTGATWDNVSPVDCVNSAGFMAEYVVTLTLPHAASTALFEWRMLDPQSQSGLEDRRFAVSDVIVSINVPEQGGLKLWHILLISVFAVGGITGAAVVVRSRASAAAAANVEKPAEKPAAAKSSSRRAAAAAAATPSRKPSATGASKRKASASRPKKPSTTTADAAKDRKDRRNSLTSTATAMSSVTLFGSGDDYGSSTTQTLPASSTVPRAVRSNSTSGVRKKSSTRRAATSTTPVKKTSA